ncbi:MAG: hypothetical protein DME13_14185 [Candidatus Rokuibacteriota bacterium]|nr:MAG: hypothetical protein DME13_14185 [Candidatus Rokubacteria bacterium]
MKQILIDRYGPPEEVARCAQVPDVGAPAAGEVVFDVLAFPINPADVSFCRGTYRLKPPLPATPGAECVGRVTAVGAGVSDVRPGDLVINSHGGPDMAPIPPTFGAPRRSRGAPRSPNVRSAPAQPVALLDSRRSPTPRSAAWRGPGDVAQRAHRRRADAGRLHPGPRAGHAPARSDSRDLRGPRRSDHQRQGRCKSEGHGMANFTLRVNGEGRTVAVEPDTPLLYILRNDLELNGPKFGCGLAQCGACTVLVDGKPVRSCVAPVSSVAKGHITTIEGLGTVETLHPLQRAFIEEQACQCGYCGNGMVMSAKALLDRNPRPSDGDIKAALNGHLCRCASHNRIVRAVQRAAREMRS